MVNYSQKEIDEKIEKLCEKVEGTAAEKADVKRMLTQLSGNDIGKRIIMDVPETLKIEIDHRGELNKSDAAALYYPKSKKILLSKDLKNPRQTIQLAHEMCHAVQNADGRLDIKSPYPLDKFVQNKMCEMETKLQDIVLESQLANGNKEKSAGCLFYESELKRFKETGLSQKDAERAARTSIVQSCWTGLTKLPDGLKQENIPQALRNNVNFWTNGYDFQTIHSFTYNLPEGGNPFIPSEKDIKEAERIEDEQREAFGKNQAGIDRNNSLLPKYLEKMDINLSEDWFIQNQMERSSVRDTFIITYHPYKKGEKPQKKTECYFSQGSYTLREYSNPPDENSKPVVLHEITYDGYKNPHGTEIYRNPNNEMEKEFTYVHGALTKKIKYKDGYKDTEEGILDDGTIAEIVYGNKGKDHLSTYTFKNGNQKKLLFENGKLTCEIRSGSENLKRVLLDNGTMVETLYGKKEGDYTMNIYYTDGDLVEIPFVNGKINGPKRHYNKEKQLLSKTFYVDGKETTEKEYEKHKNSLKSTLSKLQSSQKKDLTAVIAAKHKGKLSA